MASFLAGKRRSEKGVRSDQSIAQHLRHYFQLSALVVAYRPMIQFPNPRCVWPFVIVVTLAFTSESLAEPSDIEFKLKAADYFEHTIDFMVTISLGTFAVVGWLVKDSELTSKAARIWQFIAALGAMAAGSLSLYFGYQSYLDLMSITGSGTFSYSDLSGHYGYQALFLLAELPFLLLVLLITTVWKKPK